METLYQPLRDRQFRMLMLKADKEDGFHCHLFTLDVDISLVYVALSYTWGDEGDLATVKVDGRRVQTRRNLAKALRRIYQLGHFMVWADALCINQQDLEERASQVQMMGSIYSNAQQVFVWLDPVSERTALPRPFLEILQVAADTDPRSFNKQFNTLTKDPESLRLLTEFLSCKYWLRAWIMQEIAMARVVYILLADCMVPWDKARSIAIARGLVSLEHHLASGDRMQRGSIQGVEKIHQLHCLRQRKGGNLLTLLAHSDGTEQREEQDIVFSKLGLASDGAQLVPRVDYSKSCREVFIELARNSIRKKRNLGILCAIFPPFNDEEVMDYNLPSWVPDWKRDLSLSPTNYFTVASPELIFRAGWAKGAPLPSGPADDSEILAVHGFVYDRCRGSRSTLSSSRPPEQSGQISGAQNTYASARDAVAYFYRTATANQVMSKDLDTAQVLPTEDLPFLIKTLQGYFKDSYAKSFRWKAEGAINRWSSRFLGHSSTPDYSFQAQFYSAFEDANCDDLSIGTRSLKSWALECDVPEVQTNTRITAEQGENRRLLALTIGLFCGRRDVIEGERGGIFLVPFGTEPGDEVCILAGCDLPMVLRESDDGKYRVIGGCYVDGIMHGEAMKEYLSHSELQEFLLI